MNHGKSLWDINISSSPASNQTPCEELPVTSTSKVLIPSGSELTLMLLHYLFCVFQLATGQSIIPRELNLWLQPELRLTFRADNVNMLPRFLS